MAFTNFYIDQAAGASNLNAGSTSANASGSSAAAFTYAGGTFVRATGVFTPASGDPAADGVTVGTYASVYTTAGAVAATFVAQITARDATTITVDITTLKWGVATSVSEAAGATTLKVSGAWASEVVLAATGLGTFTAPVSTKINFTGNLAVAASRTISMDGAQTAPIWFSGYNTAPGDLDADTTNALAKPVWTLGATFILTTSGDYQVWSGLSVLGERSGPIWQMSGVSPIASRVRSENTSSNAAAIAFTSTVVGLYLDSWFKCPTTATTTGVVNASVGSIWIRVTAEGGGIAGFNGANQTNTYIECIGLNNTGAAFLNTTGSARLFSCTVYGATVDCVKWTGTPAAGASVVGCLFSGLNGSTATTNGVNNASGTNTSAVMRAQNVYYNVTNPEVGFGDHPSISQHTDSNPIVTSATDMTPVSGSRARGAYLPPIVEAQTFYNYANRGAVQHADSGGFVGIVGDGA